jgi:hypothetical protein
VPSLTDPASGGWSDYSPWNSGNQSRSRRELPAQTTAFGPAAISATSSQSLHRRPLALRVLFTRDCRAVKNPADGRRKHIRPVPKANVHQSQTGIGNAYQVAQVRLKITALALRIQDSIHEFCGPASLGEIAEQVGVNPDKLDRPSETSR